MDSVNIELVIAAVGFFIAALFGRWGLKKSRENKSLIPPPENTEVFEEAQKQLQGELNKMEDNIVKITTSPTPAEDTANLLKNRRR